MKNQNQKKLKLNKIEISKISTKTLKNIKGGEDGFTATTTANLSEFCC